MIDNPFRREETRRAYMRGYADGKADAIRHGQWVHDKDGKTYCSECGGYSSQVSSFCPACGSRQDRGDNGE